MSTEQVIAEHLRFYPESEITDLIKLLHQSEFGPSHFIEDTDSSLERLEKELAMAKPDGEHGILDIGNGLCRISLAAAAAWKLSPETLNAMFVNTANTHRGSTEGMEEKLSTLLKMCREKRLPFDCDKVEGELIKFRESGYRAVGHSRAYAEKYKPSYRVIKKRYADFISLFIKIDDKLSEKTNPVIAIEGNAASGKSSLANCLREIYACNIIRTDHFFVPFDMRTKERMSEIGGNVDYVRFEDEVIKNIFSDGEFTYRIYDCKTDTFSPGEKIDPAKMSVVEGAYSLHPRFGNIYDIKVFLSADLETQRKRISERNGKEVLKVFLSEWIPRENAYFDKYGIRESCDLVYETRNI